MVQGFTPAQPFGVDLGQFFQACPQSLVGSDSVLAVLLLSGCFEQELQDMTRTQTAGQIVKGTMLLSLSTGAVGFATSGEALDIRGAQKIRRNGQLAQERGFALAQGQGGGAAQLIYLSQVLG